MMIFITILLSVSMLSSPLFAQPKEKPVTPYGDFCPSCSKYGTCRNMMSDEDARSAMFEYYHRRGFDIEVERMDGRFIRAKVKERGRIVDVIIFDRKTGRLRSIY